MGVKMTPRASPSRTSRHLRWEVLEARLDDGPPSFEPIAGAPKSLLFVDAHGARLGVRFYTKDVAVPTSPLAEVSVRSLGAGRSQLLEVSTGNRDLYREFYGFCCAIADRIQLDREPPAKAITATLRAWAALIRQRTLLSTDRQVGLLGELLFLNRVAESHDWKSATDCWRGPDSEEHDFTLPRVDVEVKTTRNERRLHQIDSLTQLRPKLNRPLVLVSIQVTPSSGKSSTTLPDMVASTMAKVAANAPVAADAVREQLARLGWSDSDSKLYPQRYQLRTAMAGIAVDKQCPAIVPETLAALSKVASARIERVSYTIDVDGIGVLDGTVAFERLVFGKRGRL
jgi:hypothetical protein